MISRMGNRTVLAILMMAFPHHQCRGHRARPRVLSRRPRATSRIRVERWSRRTSPGTRGLWRRSGGNSCADRPWDPPEQFAVLCTSRACRQMPLYRRSITPACSIPGRPSKWANVSAPSTSIHFQFSHSPEDRQGHRGFSRGIAEIDVVRPTGRTLRCWSICAHV